MDKKKRTLVRIMIMILLAGLLTALLYQLNLASPRMDVSELGTLSACRSDGPVLLTGGRMTRDEEGRACYVLPFHWEGTGCLYFGFSAIIRINGEEVPLQSVNRGSIYTLDPAQSGGDYEVVISSGRNSLLPIKTSVYLGTRDQLYEFAHRSSNFSIYVRGMCFSISLLSLILYLFKPSENYLLWLALLSFFRGGYSRLSDLLGFLTWIPGLGFLQHETVYLVLSELLTAVFQYKIMQFFMPVRIGKLPFPWIAALGALPVLLVHRQPVPASVAGLAFFALLYLCYLVCFLRLPEEAAGERSLLFAAWVGTTVLRFFECLCELGIFPSGVINLQFRLRGLTSILYVIAFFVVVGKRFAQKFQEADDLNGELEAQIRQKTRQQTVFVRSMLHNLKTPLFSLSGYSDMALRSVEKRPEQARQYMEKAREKAIFAGELIDHLFLVTQMDADMVQMRFAPVDLRHLLEAVLDTPTAGQENKTIRTRLEAPENVYLQADQLYLRQAIQNIVDNARIHTPDGGSTLLSVQTDAQGAEIHIRDTGPGIAPEEIDKIFDAYYSNRHGKQQSSGLGLYIASEIVKRHRGRLRVESSLGEGSDFILWLPYSNGAEPSENI